MKSSAEKIIKELEQKFFNEGFEAGWIAAREHVQETLKKPLSKEFTEDSKSKKTGNPFKKGAGQSYVYDYMNENPGKKGKDIIAVLAPIGVSGKTVRNAFHRLKRMGLAVNEDGWRLL